MILEVYLSREHEKDIDGQRSPIGDLIEEETPLTKAIVGATTELLVLHIELQVWKLVQK